MGNVPKILKMMRYLITTPLALALTCTSGLAQPVIPGAVGFGMETPAGRGGQIIRVTTVEDGGRGSLRACVVASGPRVCVFEVAGTIALKGNLTVKDPYLTIAGQTAPEPGILLRGAALAIKASDVLVQHIAIRAGDDLKGPALHSRDTLKILGTRDTVHDVVIDHCSLSWAIDEVVEVWGKHWDNVTLSNNIISEPLRDAPEQAGKDQGYGILIDTTSGRVALIGNLIAHVHNRTPRSAAERFVFVNNVVYNAGIIQLNLYGTHGLKTDNSIVGNVFINGRDTTARKPVLLNGEGIHGLPTALVSGTRIYLSDNLADNAGSDPWSVVLNKSGIANKLLKASDAPVWLPDLEPLSTRENAVVEHVLSNAGTRPAERNAVDTRVIEDVRNGTGRIINCVADDGSSRCEKNAGGWPELPARTRELILPATP
ncbi:MAG TPA: hypothetical protein VE175_05560, partial [Woeseiaceae bacterium]|nr:hypothetical protein [Woeseiaceae bacterium]